MATVYGRATSLTVFLALVSALGCGGTAKKTMVSGKVTLNGKPVDGEIAFVGSDKTVSAPIGPGTGMYKLQDPPSGAVKVTIKSLAIAPKVVSPATVKDTGVPTAGSGAVAAPPKYATPAGGLTYDVKEGEQTKDFELTP